VKLNTVELQFILIVAFGLMFFIINFTLIVVLGLMLPKFIDVTSLP
jgi:hypothetical protein